MVSEMTLRSRYDGLGISMVLVRPSEEPKAILQLAHGLCGCKERYMQFMQFMAGRGVACIAGDHRGHGGSVKSQEDLGYMYEGGYLALVDDMRMITSWAHNTFPGKPLYLLGHSMGSMAARIYAKYDDTSIDGLILCGSPSWNPMSYVGKAMTWLLCHVGLSHQRLTFSQTLTSNSYNRRFAGEGYQAWTCSDPEARKEFQNNPRCNFNLTANGSYNIMSMMIDTYRPGEWAMRHPSMPILFISGADDPMMLSEKGLHHAAQNICDRGYLNVSSAIYPYMRHEVLNEIGKEEVWSDILDFMGITPRDP